MGTVTRPELSKKNPYWIERHRYYELKHFCLQYPIWEKAYKSLDALSKRPQDLLIFEKEGVSDPTGNCAVAMAEYSEKMDLVKEAAIRTSQGPASDMIFRAVTQGLSYDVMVARDGEDHGVSRDWFYKLYRRFFYILNQTRK